MSLLRGLLEQPLEDLSYANLPKTTSVARLGGSKSVVTVNSGETGTTATSVTSQSSSNGPKTKTIIKIPSTTLHANRGRLSTNPYWQSTNPRGESRKVTIKDLTQEIYKLKLFEPQHFTNYAAQNPGTKAYEIWWELSNKASANWTKQLALAVRNARSMTPDTPYLTRIENYNYNGNELFANLYYQDYRKILDHHGITKTKLQKWFKTLAQDNGKRNTIYMCGRANSGKTTIIELLSAFYEPWEIGRAQPQSAQSNFFLQDLVGKRLFHADEILATPLNIDTLKLLLEGNKDLASDVKYGDKETIIPRPVLIGTNDPLWINFSTAAEPILARCEFLQVKRSLPKLRYIKPKDGEILKYVLKKLYDYAFDGKKYETWAIDIELENAISNYVTQEPDFNLEQITEYENGN